MANAASLSLFCGGSMGAEPTLSNINFFICSTYVDLSQHRKAIIDKLKGAAGVINAQEFFGARAQEPLSTCLEELDKSDVFVMLLAHRYGSIESSTGKSFSELEYDRAVASGKPRFAFLMGDEHPVPPKYVSKGADAEKLQRLKDRVAHDLTVDFFTTTDDVAEKVLSSLRRELPKHGFRVGTPSTETQPVPAELLSSYVKLPKLFSGRLVELTVKLGKTRAAYLSECDALSFHHGAALHCEVEFVDPKFDYDIRSKICGLFATESTALELLELARSNSTIKLTARTVCGDTYKEEPIYGYQDEHPYAAALTLNRRRVVVDTNRVHTGQLLGLEYVQGALATS